VLFIILCESCQIIEELRVVCLQMFHSVSDAGGHLDMKLAKSGQVTRKDLDKNASFLCQCSVTPSDKRSIDKVNYVLCIYSVNYYYCWFLIYF
jgi:hypothetical protein